jgi:NAD(P)H dehydrogenase (quinone)
VPTNQVFAATRKPEALADLAARGMIVRKADFDDPAGIKHV